MAINWEDLPDCIQAYKQKIQATCKSSIEMELQPAEHLTLWQSKVGGNPYLPVGVQYPKSLEGEYLQLLAQINFAELPENDDYPKAGILQFFINPHDDLYGLDFDDQQKQNGFRVIFYETVTQELAELQQAFPGLDTDDFMSPISGQSAIEFEKSDSYIDLNDFEFTKKISDPYALNDDDSEAFCDEYSEIFSGNGHR